MIAIAAFASDVRAGDDDGITFNGPVLPDPEPFEHFQLDYESALIWRASNSTSIDYVVAPQILSLRTPYHFRMDFDEGASLVLRGNFALLAEGIIEGPESYYLGVHGSPSLEYWCPDRQWHAFFAIGGGVGWVDSHAEIEGAQGQDFTLNWFMKSGFRYQIDENLSLTVGAFFQHLSNGGATDPNPGLDAVGPMLGLSWRF